VPCRPKAGLRQTLQNQIAARGIDEPLRQDPAIARAISAANHSPLTQGRAMKQELVWRSGAILLALTLATGVEAQAYGNYRKTMVAGGSCR
jgi:hypothetical protein